MCGPMRGAIMGIAVFEGWAKDLEDAEAKAAGRRVPVRAQPPLRRRRADDRHDHASASRCWWSRTAPSATAPTAPSTRASARSCASAATMPRCWRAWPGCATCWGRRWAARSGRPAASRSSPSSPAGSPWATRCTSGTSPARACCCACWRRRWRARPKDTETLARCLDFIGKNDQFFLNVAMAMGKAITDPARGIEGSSVVTAMSRNGTDFGIRVSGTGDTWFTAPVEMPVGLYFPGYTRQGRQSRHGRLRDRRDGRPRRLRHGRGAGRRRLRRRGVGFGRRGLHPRDGRDHRRQQPGMDDPGARRRRRADRHRHPPGGRDGARADHQYRHRPPPAGRRPGGRGRGQGADASASSRRWWRSPRGWAWRDGRSATRSARASTSTRSP